MVKVSLKPNWVIVLGGATSGSNEFPEVRSFYSMSTVAIQLSWQIMSLDLSSGSIRLTCIKAWSMSGNHQMLISTTYGDFLNLSCDRCLRYTCVVDVGQAGISAMLPLYPQSNSSLFILRAVEIGFFEPSLGLWPFHVECIWSIKIQTDGLNGIFSSLEYFILESASPNSCS